MNNGNAILAKIETNMIKIKGFGVKKLGSLGLLPGENKTIPVI